MPRQKKTAPARRSETPTTVGKSRFVRPVPTSPEQLTDAQRIRILWASVAGVMLVVIAGWIVLLRSDHFGVKDSAGNPFQAIFERVKGVFLDDRVPFESNPATTQRGSEAQLRELRERVFPQFGSPDTNQPVNGE